VGQSNQTGYKNARGYDGCPLFDEDCNETLVKFGNELQGVYIWDTNNRNVKGEWKPLNIGFTGLTGDKETGEAGCPPLYNFVNLLRNACPNRPVFAINQGTPSTSANDWKTEYAKEAVLQYNEAVEKLPEFLNTLDPSLLGDISIDTEIDLRSIMWMQGEADENTDPDVYESRTDEIFKILKEGCINGENTPVFDVMNPRTSAVEGSNVPKKKSLDRGITQCLFDGSLTQFSPTLGWMSKQGTDVHYNPYAASVVGAAYFDCWSGNEWKVSDDLLNCAYSNQHV
jgi:hypothetical protein